MPPQALEPVRALSIWQPEASLLAWQEAPFVAMPYTAPQGLLAIHATDLADNVAGRCEALDAWPALQRQGASAEGLPTNAILALTWLRRCVPCGDLAGLPPVLQLYEERVRGWCGIKPGLQAWHLTIVKRLEPPLPAPVRRFEDARLWQVSLPRELCQAVVAERIERDEPAQVVEALGLSGRDSEED